MSVGKIINETLFSNDLIPSNKESLFQKNKSSVIKGKIIISDGFIAFSGKFNFL
jgi:hypothetical protein